LGNFSQAKVHIRNFLQDANIERFANINEIGLAAIVLGNEGEQELAVELLGRLSMESDGLVGWFWKWPLVQRLIEQLKSELGEELYQQAWEQGKKRDVHEIVRALLECFEE
jgi:hypothetical protein